MNDYNAADLLAALQGFGYVSKLAGSAGEAFAASLELVETPAGSWLFRQGDAGDGMYVLFKGVMKVVRDTENGGMVILDVIDPGTAVGELALLTGQPRSAGLQAVSDSALIRISRTAFAKLAEEHSELRLHMAELATPRLQNIQIGEILAQHFGDLDAQALHFLKRHLTWRHVARGETLFKQGAPGDAMAILINGRLRVFLETATDAPKMLGEIGRGEKVGEYSLLTGEPRSATVIAVRDSDVLMLNAHNFERLSQDFPQLAIDVAREIALRAQQNGAVRGDRTAALTLAVLPIGEAGLSSELALKLEQALSGYGSTRRLDAAGFDAQFGRENAAQTPAEDPFDIAIAGLLNQEEAAHQFVLYEAEAEWSEWTRRCLRNADRVVLVADVSAAPVVDALEARVFALDPRPNIDLVLIHPAETAQPSGTAAWLDDRPELNHHHMRLETPHDLGRLARRLIGRPLGLVLGGGAARGYAHIGVYLALCEAGLEIDIFGGTSMGAVMAGAMALYVDADHIIGLTGKYGSKQALLDLTLPTTAVYRSGKVTAMLQDVFGDVLIEDLWVPFFCISSNLSKSEPFIHRRGPLWKAVRASMAIPGVFAPISEQGDILIDGGVMNNLPADVMRLMVDQGPVIAVNANPRKERPRTWEFGPSISGWEVLRSRLLPGRKAQRVPTLVGTVLRALALNSNYHLQHMEDLADLFIQLDTSEFGIMDWSAYPALIDLGYETAQEDIRNWLAMTSAN